MPCFDESDTSSARIFTQVKKDNFMKSTANLDQLIAGVRKEETDAIAAYEQLYSDLAEGKDSPDPAAVFEILRRAERTTDELQEDVLWRKKRNEKIATYLEIPKLVERQQKVDNELTALVAEKQKMIDQYNQKIRPLDSLYEGLKMQIRALIGLDRELKDGCRCEALLTGLEEAEVLLKSKLAPLNSIEKEIRDITQGINYWTQMQQTSDRQDKQVASDNLKVLKPQLRDLKQKWETLKLDTDRLESECDRIRQEMIIA
jgi:archaellum component FlaC